MTTGLSAAAIAAKNTSWNTHDTRLLVVAVLGIALIVVLSLPWTSIPSWP